jgi:hypothetical protein
MILNLPSVFRNCPKKILWNKPFADKMFAECRVQNSICRVSGTLDKEDESDTDLFFLGKINDFKSEILIRRYFS